MPPKTNVVPDTNIFISAALSHGYCYSWLVSASEPSASYKLFTSEKILEEVSSKLISKFNFTQSDVAAFFLDVDDVFIKVRPRTVLDVVRDSDDNMILECAVEARASLIITFDKDLLTLKRYGDIQIAHPSMIKYWF
jgi:putative PIN family toxin of toxin-antitoxin system